MVLENAGMCKVVDLRLQPYSSGSYVSGKTKHDKLCDSHKCGQTGHESAHAGDDNDGVAEPLASAALDGGHVHVSKGACSHDGDGVVGGARRLWAKTGSLEMCSGVSQLQQKKAMACDAH